MSSYVIFTGYEIPTGRKITPMNRTVKPNITNYTREVSTPVLMEFNKTQYWIKSYQVMSKCLTGWKIINGYNKSRNETLESLPVYFRTRC